MKHIITLLAVSLFIAEDDQNGLNSEDYDVIGHLVSCGCVSVILRKDDVLM